MPALGHNSYVAIAKEVTWGTKVITGFEFIEYLNEGLDEIIEEKVGQGINNGRVRTKRQQGAKNAAGPFTWEVNVEDGIGHILKGLLPTEVFVDDGAGNGGQHTFTTPGALTPGYTIQKDTDVAVRDLFGGRISNVVFNLVPGEFVQATVAWTFKNGDGGVTQVPVYTTQLPLIYHTGAVQIDGVAAEIATVALTIDSGMKVDRRVLASDLIIQQQPGMFGVSGTMEMAFDDVVERDKYLNGTATKLSFDFTGPVIGTTTRRLRLVIPTAFYNGEIPKTTGADAETRLNLPFNAVRTGGGTPDELVEVKLDNSRRSAY